MREPQLVRVEWLDSHQQTDTWTTLDAIRDVAHHGAMLVHTCGWLVDENSESLTVAHSYWPCVDGGVGEVAGAITIPKVAITRRES